MNIKKVLSIAVICVLPLLSVLTNNLYAQGISFEKGLFWNQVLQKAKAENKYILVDCYATWCGPCKYMDKSVYPNDTVGNFYNEKFISVKVQMDTSKSDNGFIKGWYSDASMLKNKYKVSAFPTYLFFTPNGDIIHRDVGEKRPKEFITVGAEALNPDKQYYRMLERYRRNEIDAVDVTPLVRKVKYVEGEELAGKIANDYINQLPIDSLFSKDNIWLMWEFTKSTKDRGFAIIRDSSKRICETELRLTEHNCKAKALQVINNEAIKPYITTKAGKPDWKRIKSNLKKYGPLGDEAFTLYKPGIIFKTEIEPVLKVNSDWNQILPLIEKQNLGKNSEFVIGSTIIYYLNGIATYRTEKNCKNLVAAASYYADSFPTFLSVRALNDWAWTIFEYSKDKDELSKALAWSKHSLELQADSQEPDEIDTYANILYKLGSVSDAIVWEQKAVDAEDARAKKYNSSARPVFSETVEKMKNGRNTWPAN